MTVTTSSRIATFAMAAFVVVSLWMPTLSVPAATADSPAPIVATA